MPRLLDIPSEVILYILSFLDFPDLDALSRASPGLTALTQDPVLHKYWRSVVAPSRVNHNLFGKSPQGLALRPTVGELVHRGVIRGLGIERRWRTGGYFYSTGSIVQYENSLALFRRHVSHVLSLQLRRRSLETRTSSFTHLLSRHVLPISEASSVNIDRSLIPILRRLKWAMGRDQLARLIKQKGIVTAWLEGPGRRLVSDEESEKVRLAICPNIRGRIEFWERGCVV